MGAREVRITNGDQEGFCMEESVETWEANGWTRADDGSSSEETEGYPEPVAATEVEED